MFKFLYALLLSFLMISSASCLANDADKKMLRGVANISTSFLEIPKNIINTTNESNIIYGLLGGSIKGAMHTIARTFCGIADIVTFPLHTKPIVYPALVWDDFDADTKYTEIFRLNE